MIIFAKLIMQEESLNSWNEEQTVVYDSDKLVPQDLIKLIDVLKKCRISQIDAQFHFGTEMYQRKFLERLQREKEIENDDFQKQNKPKMHKKSKVYYQSYDDMGKFKNELLTNSPIITEVFMKAYQTKIKKLKSEQNVQIFKAGKKIIIAKESRNDILMDQMMALYKRLKIYCIYRNPTIWKIVESSLLLQKQLLNEGISCHFHSNKQIAFYSTDFTEEDIKKIVNKKLSFTPKILDFYDKRLKHESNIAIFGLLAKSISPKIKQICETYDTKLEINENVCCFVLHMKNQVFQKQPISQLKEFISNLIFISFSMRNSRNYINQIKRMSKKYQYIEVTQYNHSIYLCINKKKMHNKDDMMFVFKKFLENLDVNSKLTIHLKLNNLMSEDSQLAERILDLVEQSKLTSKYYEEIIAKTNHNIQVSIKNPYSINSENKAMHQVKFANFLRNLLDLNNVIQKFTEQEMNETFMADNNVQSTQISSSSNLILKKELQTPQENTSIIISSKVYSKQDENLGTAIKYDAMQPASIEKGVYQKSGRQVELQKSIYEQQMIKYRCWGLKINKEKFKSDIKVYNQLYLVQKICNEDGQKVQELKFIPFTMIEANQEGFLVCLDSEKANFIPIFIVKRMS